MDVEKVINDLKEVKHEVKVGTASRMINESTNAIDNAIWTIRELQSQIPKWHLCENELPKNNDAVLCRVKSTTIESGNTYMIGSCDKGFWFLQTTEIGHHYFPITDYEVVAWMELPKFEEEAVN